VLQDDANPRKVRYAVCHALPKIGGREVQDAIPLLVKLTDVNERDMNLRYAAGWTLASIGKGDERAFAAIFAMLSDGDNRYQGIIAKQLGRLGMHPKKCVPLIVASLKKNPDFPGRIIRDGPVLEAESGVADPRWWFVEGLASFGPTAWEAVPVLRDMMNNDKDYHPMRRHCLHSLVAIWGEESISELVKLVQAGGDDRTVDWAIAELGAMGSRARAALPVLQKVDGAYGPSAKRAIYQIEKE
jgi:hypothetical protein